MVSQEAGGNATPALLFDVWLGREDEFETTLKSDLSTTSARVESNWNPKLAASLQGSVEE